MDVSGTKEKRAPVKRRPPPRGVPGLVVCTRCKRWWTNGREPESRRCPSCGGFLPEFEA